MGRCHDIDVMATPVLQADHRSSQIFTGHFIATSTLADIIVLAEFAGKVAVGNKDRP
jgi:hypothetical protein